MLVRRQCDIGRNTWSSSKLAIYPNATRMSNFEPLPPQPDWREQYSPFSLQGDSGLLQPSFDHTTRSSLSESNPTKHHSIARPLLEHRHSLGPLRQDAQSTPIIERPDSAPVDANQQGANPISDDSLVSTESTALSLASLGSNPLSSASSAPAQQGTLANEEGTTLLIEPKEEEDDEDDEDDEMLDAEGTSAPQTAAERRAERRKMKRFRCVPSLHTSLCALSSNKCLV